jgi:hypothetical protein
MEHKIIDINCDTVELLTQLVMNEQREGWSVVAMGRILGDEVMVLVKREKKFEHEIIPVEAESRAAFNAIIAEKIAEGGKVCAIGVCGETPIIIIKKVR